MERKKKVKGSKQPTICIVPERLFLLCLAGAENGKISKCCAFRLEISTRLFRRMSAGTYASRIFDTYTFCSFLFCFFLFFRSTFTSFVPRGWDAIALQCKEPEISGFSFICQHANEEAFIETNNGIVRLYWCALLSNRQSKK